ncbi:hypothetical protein [Orientia tsutsugamushi]|uniref:hypothetical protein n=1 Tax=Orientia tsutsugamushi TaxID=784 RepID=UPI000D5A3C3E|nr:conjugal transfer protein TraN [Orientia tsutsugamushi]
MRLLSILTLITLNISSCIASMQSSYNEASNYNRLLSKLDNDKEVDIFKDGGYFEEG